MDDARPLIDPRLRLAVPAVWVVVAGLWFGADDWTPLAATGLGAVAVATLALGVAWRWWAIPASGIALVVVGVAIRPGQEDSDTFLTLLFLTPAVVIVAVLAAIAGRWARRTDIVLALAGIAIALTATGVALGARTIDHHPSSPVEVDATTGSLPEVPIGGDPAALPARLGRPRIVRDWSSDDDLAPLGADGGGLSGPSSLDGDFIVHRFERVAVFVRRGRIVGYVTTGRNVELGEGVGVGDSIDLIRKRDLPYSCFGVALGSDSVRPRYPACDRRLGRGRLLYAGGDPIDSIWVVP